MKCPTCGGRSIVTNVRTDDGVRRRIHQCAATTCAHKFSSIQLLVPLHKQLDVAKLRAVIRGETAP